MTKAELRKLYLEKRASLPLADASVMSGRIAQRFFDNLDLDRVRTVHAFIRMPKFNEIDTSAIYFRLWRDRPDIVTVAPRTDRDPGEIESVVFDRSTDWSENRWAVREPLEGDVVPPAKIDVVLVPLLCFDTQLQRVGYGKGFYDRFLSHCRPDCLKVGLSYFPPIDEISETGRHDIKLDICITPDAVVHGQ